MQDRISSMQPDRLGTHPCNPPGPSSLTLKDNHEAAVVPLWRSRLTATGCISKTTAQIKASYSSNLFNTSEVKSGVVCQILGFTVRKVLTTAMFSSEEYHQYEHVIYYKRLRKFCSAWRED